MFHWSYGMSPHHSHFNACPQEIQRAGHCQLMHINASPKLSLPWDNSIDSFYTQESDDDSLTIIDNPDNQQLNLNPPIPVITNPYLPPSQSAPQNKLITTLQSWIIPRWVVPQPTANLPPAIPAIIEIAQEQAPILPPPASHYQPPITTPNNNHHWGNPMHLPKPLSTFCILSRNINTLLPQQNYLQWKAASHAITQCNTDAIALQETNLSWNKIHKQKVQQIFRKPTSNIIIATSSSTEISTIDHQRGGTLQALIGSWVSCAVQTGQDPSGLGCWSYVKIQGWDHQWFIILSGYHMGKNQMVDMGSKQQHLQPTVSIAPSTRLSEPQPMGTVSRWPDSPNHHLVQPTKSSVNMYWREWQSPTHQQKWHLKNFLQNGPPQFAHSLIPHQYATSYLQPQNYSNRFMRQ